MGTIKATNIEPIADNGTVTLGSSGDQFTLATGAKASFLYPAFEAHSNTAQSLTDNTYAKVALQTEVLDTNSNFDNSSNYRFTPTVAGKYYIEGQTFNMGSDNTSVRNIYVSIYKNGSQYKESRINFHGSEITFGTIQVSAILDMNGSSDYVELYAATDVTSGSASLREGTKANYFLGYRLGT
jgi:hypothetical protein